MFLPKNKSRGFLLIDALIGIFLFVTGFVGLYGVLTSSLSNIAQNKARLGAMALVNEQIEYMRSLPFSSVGVVMGNPSGTVPQVESGSSVLLNGIQYTRRNVVFWVDDPADGVAPADTINTDYKQVKVEVSWDFRGQTFSFFSITNIAPKGLETNVPGGVFKFTIFSGSGPVSGANIHIYKQGVLSVDRITNDDGVWYENGVPPGAGYQITVTKSGYNTAKTYDISAGLPNPNPGHFTSIDDNVNPISFQIDKVSNLAIHFFNTPVDGAWNDSFSDASKLASNSSIETKGGNLVLTNNSGVYNSSGTARSIWVAPTDFYQWKTLSWNANTPANTDYFVHLYYNNGGTPTLIPDTALTGNVTGFSSSPVDLSLLDASYTSLSVGISESTSDTSVTPSISDWQISYLVQTVRPDFSFTMAGTKTMGTDSGNNPVYKLNQIFSADSSGLYATSSLESDLYSVTKTNYELSEICGAPESSLPKINVNPESDLDVYINATTTNPNSILIGVKNSAGNSISNALVKIYRASPAFSNYKKTGLRCGQVFWNGLSAGTFTNGNPYSLDVSAPPYTSTTTIMNVDVLDYSYRTITFTGTSLPPPGVSLTANPTTITLGGSSVLTWSDITNATSCNASGSWTGSKNVGGGTQTVSPAVTSNYTLLCAGSGGSTSVSDTITVVPPAPVITNNPLTATGVVGNSFSTYAITGTNSPTFFSAISLPAGLSVNSSSGAITGTPTTVGISNVTISATNAGGSGIATLVITINPQPPVITNSPLTASGEIGSAFSTYTIAGTNNPTSFSATNLPNGLSVNTSNGSITGTPTSSGVTSVTIGATNAGGTGTATLVITVTAPLALDNSTPATVKTSGKTITSNSFTPPVNSVLYIAISSDRAIASITDNRSSHLSYVPQGTYGNGGGTDSVVTLYTATVTTSQSMTVSITQSNSDGVMMNVLVVTGAKTSDPVGSIGGGRNVSGVVSDTYVSTTNKSWGWLIYADQNANTSPTAGTNQTKHDSYVASDGTFALIKRNSTTPASGTSVSLNTTAPISGNQTAHLYFEMNQQ